MDTLTRYIIKNENYELVRTESPLATNCVLVLDTKNSSYNKYKLLNGLVVQINFRFDHDRNIPSSHTFNYNDVEILSGGTNWQSLLDFLNVYGSYTSEKLKIIVRDIQNKEKSKLEVEIEALKTEKDALENKIHIYNQIDKKYEEIKKLFSKLEE